MLLWLLACVASPQDDPGIPSSIETLFVVEMSHCDVGFTAPPSAVAKDAHDHIVQALNIADNWPEFRFTIESAWQLQEFDKRASAPDKQRLEARFAGGRFALGAGYVNPHSGVMSEEQLHRWVHPAFRLSERYGGAPRDAALLDDVPGFTRAMPRVLANSGVRYLLLGANDFVGGKPEIPLADRPFWWEAPDGSRVLTWLTYTSYAEGFFDWGLLNVNTAFTTLSQRLPEFEAAGYPYDAVLVMRGFDNAAVSAGMVSLAKQWNSTYDNPKIRLATPQEFFAYLETKYGDVFPTYRGDASGMWESAGTVTPLSAALVRQARSRLPDLEALHAVLRSEGGVAYPVTDFRRAWDLSVVFDEHSGGGGSWPGLLTLAEVNQQNQEHVDFAVECAAIAQDLEARGLALAGPASVPIGQQGLVVFNLLGEAHTGLIEVDCGSPQPPDLRLVDPAGGPDPVFRWTEPDRSALAFEGTVPARGWRRWEVRGGGSAPPPPTWTPGDRALAGDHELILDAVTGEALQLVEQSTGFDWLAHPNAERLGQVWRGTNQQVFFGISKTVALPASAIAVEDPGPVFRSLRVFGPQGKLLREYRLHESGAIVDLAAVLRRHDLPYVPHDKHSHHYGLAFPANLALPTTLAVDGPDGWFEPGADSLPGAALGHFGASTGARLQGAQGRWLTVTALDSILVDAGEMDGGALASVETDESALTWKLIRFASETEVSGGAIVPFEAEPGLPAANVHRYRARFGDSGDPPPSRDRMRRDVAPPLAAWVEAGAAAGAVPAARQLLDLQGPAELLCWKRSEADDGFVLRLRAGSAGGTAQLTPPAVPSAAFATDLVERPLQALTVSGGTVTVPLVPRGVVSVLLRD